MTPSNEPVVTFDERPASLPPAIRAWFYPGRTSGQEFMYWRNADTRLADARTKVSTIRPESDKAIASEVGKQIRQ